MRLPGKVLMDIGGKPALTAVLNRVRRSRTIKRIIVATTTGEADDAIVELCRREGVSAFRGDELDVLGRYRDAARTFGCDPVVRLTADCPMLDPDVIDEAVEIYQTGRYDYVSNIVQRRYPDGLDVEVFSRAAIEEAAERANHPYLREHVTPYINGLQPELGAGRFRVGHLLFAADFAHVRWTLDNIDDLTRIRKLLAVLPDGYSWLDALSEATREPTLIGLPR